MLITKNTTVKELGSIVIGQLKLYDIWAVLVGGSCVTIYSNNAFMSYDLDFVSYEPISKIKNALQELGFLYDKKKYFTHPNSELFLEFLTPPVAVGNEFIKDFKSIDSALGELRLLTPTDCVKDRLAAYYHWNDIQSLEQAVCVAKEQNVEFENIEDWSNKEKQADKYNFFFNKLKGEK